MGITTEDRQGIIVRARARWLAQRGWTPSWRTALVSARPAPAEEPAQEREAS